MPSKRNHVKSRLGCGQCKQRRIKCDQVPPRCGSCTKKGIECDYRALDGIQAKIQVLTKDNYPNSTRQTRIHHGTPKAISDVLDMLASPGSFSVDDMRLMHHFTLVTSRTMGVLEGEDYDLIWQTRVPVLACQYSYLMEALLSITAAHLSETEIARHHSSKAVRLFAALRSITTCDEQDSVLCYSILMAFSTFALDCSTSDGISDPIAGAISAIRIMRTAVSLLGTFQNDLQEGEKGDIGRLLLHLDYSPPSTTVPEEVQLSLDRLNHILDSQKHENIPEEHATLRDEALNLQRFYSFVSLRPGRWKNVLRWPLSVSINFVALLEKQNLAALAILSHWCVPLHCAPQRWFIKDWPQRVIQAVADQLEETIWRDAIDWPLAESCRDQISAEQE